MGPFYRRHLLFYWLLRGCVGNWVEMPSPKQSHSAIRYDTDPVASSTSKIQPIAILPPFPRKATGQFLRQQPDGSGNK